MVLALRQQGVDARIITTNDHGPKIDTSLPIGKWTDRHGVPVLAFSRWSPQLRTLREFAICPALNLWLARHLHTYQLLHVHALFSWPSTTAMLQARLAGVPYVLRTIGQLNHWSLRQSAGRKKLLLALLERRNLAGAAALHFTSDDESVQASDLGLSLPKWVIPLGVELPTTLNQSDRARPKGPCTVFLFLSRIHPKKQLERLLAALALVEQRQPNAHWQLQIAGDGEPAYLADLSNQIQQLGLTHRCRWLGFLTGNAKWQALQAADWFVLPSASENFGIAAVEALAAGTPPILSPDVAVASDIAAASAGLIASAEIQDLAQVLEEALAGPPPAMRAAARTMAATQYSWPVIATQLKHSYAALLR
jgi:glycosyltransferase involved in cell wall biosynthesis